MSDTWRRLIAIQPEQESQVAVQTESLLQACQDLCGGVVTGPSGNPNAKRESPSPAIVKNSKKAAVSGTVDKTFMPVFL